MAAELTLRSNIIHDGNNEKYAPPPEEQPIVEQVYPLCSCVALVLCVACACVCEARVVCVYCVWMSCARVVQYWRYKAHVL
jgi:hypothetical protein